MQDLQLPIWLQSVSVFLVGAAIGSFLNVVIFRLPRAKSLVSPSSRCGFCRSSIPAWMNIPIVSYLITLGRCIKCGSTYSFRYPLIEFLTALVFVAVWANYGWSFETMYLCLFLSALIAGSFIDLELRIIPDALTLLPWFIAVFLALVMAVDFPLTFKESLLGSLFGFGLFWLTGKLAELVLGVEALGFGDVKLMGFIGAVLGVKGVISSILVGSLVGSLFGLIMILFLRKHRRFQIPFGPFLTLGAFAVVFKFDFWWDFL